MAAANPVLVIRDFQQYFHALTSGCHANKKWVFFFFYATWSPPCKAIAPIIDEMAKQYINVVFLKIDVENQQFKPTDTMPQNLLDGITKMPTFKLFALKLMVNQMDPNRTPFGSPYLFLGKCEGANEAKIVALFQQHVNPHCQQVGQQYVVKPTYQAP